MQTLERIESELERITAESGGVVGVSFCHVESGQRLTLNAGKAFPMASTYKVAIAARLMKLIDEQRFGLDEMIQISQDDLSPGGGIIKAHFSESGVALSIHNLLTVMLTISDNTASDMLLGLAGGPEAVSEFLRSSGIEGIRVDRSTKILLTDAFGITDRLPEGRWSYQFLQDHKEAFTQRPPVEASEAFAADVRDTSTPEAMVQLLEAIFHRELLSERSSALLLDIMGRCETGESRLRGRLPKATVVAAQDGHDPEGRDQRRRHRHPAGRWRSGSAVRVRDVAAERRLYRGARRGDGDLQCGAGAVRLRPVGALTKNQEESTHRPLSSVRAFPAIRHRRFSFRAPSATHETLPAVPLRIAAYRDTQTPGLRVPARPSSRRQPVEESLQTAIRAPREGGSRAHGALQMGGSPSTCADTRPPDPVPPAHPRPSVLPCGTSERKADTNSTGVVHQTAISSSSSCRLRTTIELGSSTHSGTTADVSQNLIAPRASRRSLPGRLNTPA